MPQTSVTPSTYPPLQAPRRLLFGPGPSMVSPRVYQAMSQNVVGHLDPFFFQVADEVRSLLGYAFSTENQFNLAISGTGSSGMEAAVANFAEPGRKFALLTNGFFGDRIGEIARRQGAEVVRLAKDWGQPYDPQEAREFIRREQPHMVGFVQAETSTGMFNQAKPICEAAHEAGALVIADCVTSLGGMPVLVDENGIDIAYSCTQKGLGCPPGLAPITVSPRALERLKSRKAPMQAWYLDLQLIDSFYIGHKYHHTASATLFYALREGLAIVAEEGRENRWERHRRHQRAFVAGIEAMGLAMHVADPADRLWTLNTPRVPESVDDARVRQYLLEKRDIEIAGGFGPLAGKVFRIGLMGYGSTGENVLLILGALEEALRAQGWNPAGDARAAAERALG
ncbi:MAG TPA: alanine--glyoxylate aminotransferase family protein [Verrucomicrobiae bacterium]|nr:alanine--glyoxylate aminotransferase family protein [Verrucomicrobiae bacterium]